MNAKSSISDFENEQNRKRMAYLRACGYKIECTSQGYRVEFQGKFLHAAGTIKKPHGRYAMANLRDNVASAVSVADRHWKESQAIA